MKRPALYILSGLPGVGKTTLGKRLAVEKNCSYIRIDSIEIALANSTHKTETISEAGYLIGYQLAKDALSLGQNVVADCVNPVEITRVAWRDVGRTTNASIIDIEIICSDQNQHKNRLQNRRSDLQGQLLPTWNDIQAHEYEKRIDDRIIIDTTSSSIDASFSNLIRAIDK